MIKKLILLCSVFISCLSLAEETPQNTQDSKTKELFNRGQQLIAGGTDGLVNLAAAEAGKLETSVTINDLNNNQAPRSRSMMQSVTSLSNQTFSAALINPTTHNLITWPNGAANPAGTRLAAWMANPITITPAQALAPNFTLTFSNSRGISTLSNTVNQISGVHPGAFDMVLTIQ